MRTTLYWFSGTGNSLQMARDLAQALGAADLVPIATAVGKPVPAGVDRIGIVVPVYAFGLPLIVADFCRALQAPATPYVFGVATCGGMPGATLRQMRDLLKGRGLTLSAGFVLQMPGNYTPLYGAPSEAVQRKMLGKAGLRIPEIARVVSQKQAARVEASNPIGAWLGSLVYRLGASKLRQADTSFRVTDKCNSCGLCAKVCPVGNIVMQDGKPGWRHRCEQCLACLQWCPQEAIEFGRSTIGRRRYRHPAMTAKDFMIRAAP